MRNMKGYKKGVRETHSHILLTQSLKLLCKRQNRNQKNWTSSNNKINRQIILIDLNCLVIYFNRLSDGQGKP